MKMSSQKNFHVDKACDIFSYAKMLEFQKENNIINMKEKQEKNTIYYSSVKA